jgi:rhodanese-related sulfurtransferase
MATITQTEKGGKLKNKLKIWFPMIVMIAMLVIGNAQAEDNIPITADQAFDAYANQIDPLSGELARVAIVDVRTTAEYFWKGTAAQVESIDISGEEKIITPYNGKVRLRLGGRFLKFNVEKGERLRPVFLPVSRVNAIKTEAIALNIPYKVWDETGCSLVPNPDFADQMNALADSGGPEGGFDILILMCRSGIRSNTRDFATENFTAVYEIDRPDGKDGRGGFEGTSYSSVFNGYRGFPGRYTRNQDHPSVSWADSGLPIHIGGCP